MGLTRAQWHVKRTAELLKYVQENGHEVDGVIYWDTYPICVQDICVCGVAIMNGEPTFVDYDEDGFRVRRQIKDVDRIYIEVILKDMQQLDKNKKR